VFFLDGGARPLLLKERQKGEGRGSSFPGHSKGGDQRRKKILTQGEEASPASDLRAYRGESFSQAPQSFSDGGERGFPALKGSEGGNQGGGRPLSIWSFGRNLLGLLERGHLCGGEGDVLLDNPNLRENDTPFRKGSKGRVFFLEVNLLSGAEV